LPIRAENLLECPIHCCPPCAEARAPSLRVARPRSRRLADARDELEYALQCGLEAAEILERDGERIRAVLRPPYRDLLADLLLELELQPARLEVDSRTVVRVLRPRFEHRPHR